MRLRQFDIVRYGAFADRSFDFGDGTNDLHLVVGANEAGKSTTLAAIGDLLWGMGERPPFAFRYPYGELRLGGVLEHGGETIEFLRRKARTASLLTPGKDPLPDSSLAPYLGGLDRDGFDRMFGLNHERLRIGGQNMLGGKEDVARVLFEAGTGLSGVNEILSGLEEEAAAIFAGTARNKPLNLALKERETNLTSMRTAVMAPSRWKAISLQLAKAEEEHESALRQTRLLESRRTVLERNHRARPILAKIDGRESDIERLGPAPVLPEDAAETLRAAKATASVTEFAIGEQRRIVTARGRELDALPPRSILLDHGDEIVRLADAVALYRKDLAELPHVRRLADDVAAARRLLFEDASLPETTAIPSAIALLRARKAMDALDLAKRSVADMETAVHAARRKAAVAGQHAAAHVVGPGIEALRSALGKAPHDSVKIRAQHAGHVEAARRRSTRSLAQLAPWVGTSDELALATVPSAEVLELHRSRLLDLAERQTTHDAHVAETRTALGEARAELVRLGNLDREPPTPELLRNARQSRDAAITLVGTATGDRAALLTDAQTSVRSADELADRREAEASRVADHARALGGIERATCVLDGITEAETRLGTAQTAAEEEWATVWRAAGFASRVFPQQVAAWVEVRSQSIEASDALLDLERVSALYKVEVEHHRAAIHTALRRCDQEFDHTLDLDSIISDATSRLEGLERSRDEATRAASRAADARQVLAESDDELSKASVNRDRLASALPAALASLGVGDVEDRVADVVVSALEMIGARDEADRAVTLRVQDVEGSIATFHEDVAMLEVAISRNMSGDPAAQLTSLRGEYDLANQVERDRIRLTTARTEAMDEIEKLAASQVTTTALIGELLEAAGVTTVDALETVIDRRVAQQRLVQEVAGLRDELSDATDGLPEDVLRAEVAASSADEAASELADIKREQREIVDRISLLSADLAAARQEEREAGVGAGAAEAAQSAESARATIVDMSARYIRARSAATMLRWAINRHRETRQAPLLASAGSILANVTGGRFKGLALDWSHGEEPVIVAERGGGERCGVEQMSEGTRDQLFLALRLAAIEEKAADHSMPLICDDLFITADDGRSSRLFRQLKDLSATTQVIVFTHHEHLENVAKTAIGAGSFQIHHVRPV